MLTEKYSCTASDRSIVIQEAKTAQERERCGRVFPARVLSSSLYISREDNLLSSAGALATAWWIIAIQLKANHTSNVITTVLFEGWTNRCHSVLTNSLDSLFTSLYYMNILWARHAILSFSKNVTSPENVCVWGYLFTPGNGGITTPYHETKKQSRRTYYWPGFTVLQRFQGNPLTVSFRLVNQTQSRRCLVLDYLYWQERWPSGR